MQKMQEAQGLIPGWRRSPGEGHGHPFYYPCLENPMDRGAWQATVHRATKSRTRQKRLSIHIRIVLVSAIHQHESAIGIHMPPPS